MVVDLLAYFFASKKLRGGMQLKSQSGGMHLKSQRQGAGSQGTARQLGRIGEAGQRDVRYTWQPHIIFSGFVPELSRVCFSRKE